MYRVELLSLTGGYLIGDIVHILLLKIAIGLNLSNYRAICSQLNITLDNHSVSSTCILSTNQRIAIYAGCFTAAVVLSVVRSLLFYYICVNASRVLHNRMFASVLRAPVRFFDINPIGQ